MDIKKVLLSGAKSFVITFLGIVAAVIVGALTISLGYKPEGAMAEVAFTYVVTPLLAGIIGLLNNYLKHKDDK